MGGPTKAATTFAALLACAASLAACGGDGSSSDSTATAPAETVSARSAPFHKYSGRGPAKLHLAEFGTEGSDSDRVEVEELIDAYLRAARAGQWGVVCRQYLAADLTAEIEEIIEQAKQRVKPTCAEVVQALAESPQAKQGSNLKARPSEGVSSLRIKEGPGGGFALFHGRDGEDYWMAVKRQEDGGWGVLSLGPQPFGTPHR